MIFLEHRNRHEHKGRNFLANNFNLKCNKIYN